MKMDSERKFGCNISHLSDYSDIAEKSMEKFVSVMSSFTCTSSGSRASGLRAHLRDVQNTCAPRSTTAPKDLSRFSYVPKKSADCICISQKLSLICIVLFSYVEGQPLHPKDLSRYSYAHKIRRLPQHLQKLSFICI
ncbi:exonuclease 1-like [Telopea speciosissima]|uniref:exonuclease 1-like n=1 Tax=Telopea speciosissima TaxID=54955 RepID=UPI001CC39036|nr:exonuclease 1-like [Telopea speciosissima]